MQYTLRPARDTLTGRFCREDRPALVMQPGDVVDIETLEADWRTEKHAQPSSESGVFFKRELPKDQGQCLIGPIFIEGARPGQTLAVHVKKLVPGDWGWSRVGYGNPDHLRRINAPEGEYFLLWNVDVAAGKAVSHRGHQVSLNPFMGVMGVAPDVPGGVTTYNPGPHGGNLDCKDIAEGTTLYLPIFVEGAYFAIGDGHAAQGDGESGGTAIECPYRQVTLSFDVLDEAIPGPVLDTGTHFYAFGFSADLTDAVYEALGNMADLLTRRNGLADRREALAMLSLLGDLRITQIANEVRGAHIAVSKERLTEIGGGWHG